MSQRPRSSSYARIVTNDYSCCTTNCWHIWRSQGRRCMADSILVRRENIERSRSNSWRSHLLRSSSRRAGGGETRGRKGSWRWRDRIEVRSHSIVVEDDFCLKERRVREENCFLRFVLRRKLIVRLRWYIQSSSSKGSSISKGVSLAESRACSLVTRLQGAILAILP